MKTIVIDGLFLNEPINGINRYSIETILALDEISTRNYNIIIVIPDDLVLQIDLKKIKIVKLHHGNVIMNGDQRKYKGWTRKTAEPYAYKIGAYFVNFTGYAPRKANGVAVLHDIRPIDFNDYSFGIFQLRFKILFLINCLIAKIRKLKIVTDSQFTKKRIIKKLRIKEKNILVGYAGWQHINRIDLYDNIFTKYPFLKNKKFCFGLGSLAPHKNYKWICEIAKTNPDIVFAIAGGKEVSTFGYKGSVKSGNNVYYLGYVSDCEMKALMSSCAFFLFPSKYEGFGIPPLEALALGTKVISSNMTCLPEILGKCVYYCNPDNYKIDIQKLLEYDGLDCREKVLNKYSWKKTALIWDELFNNIK